MRKEGRKGREREREINSVVYIQELNYHISGIMRLVKKRDFAEKTFVDCSHVLPIVHLVFKQSQRKHLLIGTKYIVNFPAIQYDNK